MAPKELSRVKWLRVTLQSQTDGRHHQAKIIKGEQTAQKLAAAVMGTSFFYLITAPGIPKPITTSPTLNIQQDFTSPPLPSMFRLPSPFRVQVPAERLQSVGIICEMAPGGHG